MDRGAYLLALCRYVERNPVAAGIVGQPQDWPWSSCRAHLGLDGTPAWLDTDGLHGHLLAREPKTREDRQHAARLYAGLVMQADRGDDVFWSTALRQQIFLGDEAFAQRMQAKAEPSRRVAADVPRPQRRSVVDSPAARERVWNRCLRQCGGDRAAALRAAYRDHGMTMTVPAPLAGLSVSRVSRLITGEEARGAGAELPLLRTGAHEGLPRVLPSRPITAEDGEPTDRDLRVARAVPPAEVAALAGMAKAPSRGTPRKLDDADPGSLPARPAVDSGQRLG